MRLFAFPGRLTEAARTLDVNARLPKCVSLTILLCLSASAAPKAAFATRAASPWYHAQLGIAGASEGQRLAANLGVSRGREAAVRLAADMDFELGSGPVTESDNGFRWNGERVLGLLIGPELSGPLRGNSAPFAKCEVGGALLSGGGQRYLYSRDFTVIGSSTPARLVPALGLELGFRRLPSRGWPAWRTSLRALRLGSQGALHPNITVAMLLGAGF